MDGLPRRADGGPRRRPRHGVYRYAMVGELGVEGRRDQTCYRTHSLLGQRGEPQSSGPQRKRCLDLLSSLERTTQGKALEPK